MSHTSKSTPASTRERQRRMRWWHDARFGMFIHWGLYSQLGRPEWVMQKERIPLAQYERLADSWKPGPQPARAWAKLARQAGMKYMVMTTKHHEGFSLWDSKINPYNAVRHGPQRDLVREFVEACREFDLGVGLYYSLMDWHHPDGWKCAKNPAARRRFVAYTHGLVEELMSNYGKIDILWYDVAMPLTTPQAWRSKQLNRMVRKLQPHILINNRSCLPEDFGTPEGHIQPPDTGRAWEACMTMNGSWGYLPIAPDEDWVSARQIVRMLAEVSGGGGNLLLNIGPAPDGSIPHQAFKPLQRTGQWLALNAEAVYGRLDRADRGIGLRQPSLGRYSRKGNTIYVWVFRWPGADWAIAGFKTPLKRATILTTGEELHFRQNPQRIVFTGLPARSPDKLVNATVLKLEFAGAPKSKFDVGYVSAPF